MARPRLRSHTLRKVQHPDEAPAPATDRCRYGYPAPVAADAPPPSAHGPVRYARPPDLYESVCALSPIELIDVMIDALMH